MKIAISGSHGLLGESLVANLGSEHEVVRLARDGQRFTNVPPDAEAVIHLAGRPLICRWNDRRMGEIRASRVEGTRNLVKQLAAGPPRLLISASGVALYGDRGDEELTESASVGDGFLAGVARDWEAAAAALREAGSRVVPLRLGVVLTPKGGALRLMLPFFRLGLGGPLGDGRQYLSWVALPDLLRLVRFVLEHPDLDAPVNACAPHPVRNGDFARGLGRALHRPAIIPAPAWALRLATGKMADEMLLASTRAVPQRLEAAGFAFRYPDLEGALAHLLDRN